jgi:hypothetical protein
LLGTGAAAAYQLFMKGCVLLLVAGLAACTPVAYQKPGVTALESEADQRDCRMMAMREAHSPFGLGWGPSGYRRWVFSDPLLDRMRNESALADFCMRARGYRLQPLPSPS